jgi:hypothetical protein
MMIGGNKTSARLTTCKQTNFPWMQRQRRLKFKSRQQRRREFKFWLCRDYRGDFHWDLVTVQAAILLEATFGARRFKTASKDGSEL